MMSLMRGSLLGQPFGSSHVNSLLYSGMSNNFLKDTDKVLIKLNTNTLNSSSWVICYFAHHSTLLEGQNIYYIRIQQ